MLDPTAPCSLPDAAILNILQRVPLQQRLSSCALVCKSWAAATARATADIVVTDLTCQQKADLSAWLQQHDQWRHLELLQLAPCGKDLEFAECVRTHSWSAGQPMGDIGTLQLPSGQLGRLKTLKVVGFDLRLLPPAGAPAQSSSNGPPTEAGPFDLSAVASVLPAASTAAAQSAAAAAVPAIMPELRELKLSCNCQTPELLSLITRLTGLQLWPTMGYTAAGYDEVVYGTEDLNWSSVEQRMHNNFNDDMTVSVEEAFAALLHSNPGLKCLNLGYRGIGRDISAGDRKVMVEDVLQHLARLTNLETLVINPLFRDNPRSLAALPTSLTMLHLTGQTGPFSNMARPVLDPTETPALCNLSSLQTLTLCCVVFDPIILVDKPHLSELRILECGVYKTGSSEDGTDQEVVEHFLTILSHLTHLQTQVVDTVWTRWSRSWDTLLPADRFSALMASKELACLHFEAIAKRPLPPGALQHMFPPGKQHSRLQVFKLHATKSWVSGLRSEYYYEDDGDDEEEEIRYEDELWCVDAADICAIARSCPALRELALGCVVHGGTDVSGLLPLQAQLCVLNIQGVAFNDAAAAVVAQLTSLSSLSWQQSPGLSDAGLSKLTMLRRLSLLGVHDCPGVSDGMREKGDLLLSLGHYAEGLLWDGAPLNKYWRLSSPQDSSPDVWLQLWALLGESPIIAGQLDYSAAAEYTSSLAAITVRVVQEVIHNGLARFNKSPFYNVRSDLDVTALATALQSKSVQQLRRAVAGAILQRLDLRPFAHVRSDVTPDGWWPECLLSCQQHDVQGRACESCLWVI